MLELLKLWIRNITLSGQLSNSADVHLPWKCCKANESLFQIANLSQFWGCLLGLITAISSDFQQPTAQSNLTWIHLGSGSSHMSLSICPFLQQPNREIMQLELNNKKMGVFIFIRKKQQVFFYNIKYLFPEVCPSFLQLMSLPFNILRCIWMTWGQLGSFNIQFTNLMTVKLLLLFCIFVILFMDTDKFRSHQVDTEVYMYIDLPPGDPSWNHC